MGSRELWERRGRRARGASSQRAAELQLGAPWGQWGGLAMLMVPPRAGHRASWQFWGRKNRDVMQDLLQSFCIFHFRGLKWDQASRRWRVYREQSCSGRGRGR